MGTEKIKPGKHSRAYVNHHCSVWTEQTQGLAPAKCKAESAGESSSTRRRMKADGSTQAAGHAELFGLCVFLHLTFFSVSFAGLSSLPSVNSALRPSFHAILPW